MCAAAHNKIGVLFVGIPVSLHFWYFTAPYLLEDVQTYQLHIYNVYSTVNLVVMVFIAFSKQKNNIYRSANI